MSHARVPSTIPKKIAKTLEPTSEQRNPSDYFSYLFNGYVTLVAQNRKPTFSVGSPEGRKSQAYARKALKLVPHSKV